MGGGSGSSGGGGRVSGPPTRSKSGRTKAQSQTNVGFGAKTISKQKAKAQISAKQSKFSKSAIGRIPGMPSSMGNTSLAAQQKALDEGGTAIAVPGTAFAAQGQRYSERPGETPAEFQSRISATKPAKGSGKGYVGDIAGVTKTSNILGMDVTTFTGKTGYSPSGEKIDEPKGGGGQEQTLVAQAEAEEAESTMAMLPGETPSQYRRRVRRFGGGTIVEGGGVLYK